MKMLVEFKFSRIKKLFFANLVILLIFFFNLFTVSYGWWDQGHMTVAAVAKSCLNENEIHTIESFLEYWENDYPGMSNITVAAVWADHIKCTSHNSHCEGLHYFDDLDIFSRWHYDVIPYNPLNISIPCRFQTLSQDSGAIWFLHDTYNVFTKFGKAYPHSNEHISNHKKLRVQNTLQFKNRLSMFSINLRLRLFIHIYGDLHQPLHSTSLFTNFTPHGDSGGTNIHIKSYPSVINLHQLWDSVGTTFNLSWPKLTEPEVLKHAENLKNKYPREFFGLRLKDKYSGYNIKKIAKDSRKIAIKYVYNEINFTDPTQFDEEYIPSEDYMNKLKEICEEQIVLGGYRLANVLKLFAYNFNLLEETHSYDNNIFI